MSTKDLIHYLENQFDVRTRASGKLALIIGSDHASKISTSDDPDIVRLYNDYLPVFNAFAALYDNRLTTKAARKSSTAAVKNLFSDLKKNKVPAWDAFIQTLFPKGSPGYISLLPQGRKGMNSGGIEKRIHELSSFILNCGDAENLKDMKTAAQTVLTAINAARDLQQSKEGSSKDLSTAIEVARVNLCNYLYRNICFLAYKYFDNPKAVEAYFEFAHIRSRKTPKDDEPGKSLTIEIEPETTKEAGFAFEQSAKFYFYNYGEVPVTIYTGEKDAPAPPGAFVLEAGAEADKPVADLGPAGSRYLYFANASKDVKAMLEVVLI